MPTTENPKYRPYPAVDLPDRRWPSRVIERAPRFCSVDLRDGNQALVEPMGLARKQRMWTRLVSMGFPEIEVGFPAASQPDFDFVRWLVDGDRIPEGVTIQVLTQARPELIARTFEAIRGARRAIVHLYNSTSEVQRRVVFGLDRAGIREVAVQGVGQVKRHADATPETEVVLEYSPESFTGTELDYALEVCEAVMDAWGPTPERPLILNLPATVEMSTPNVFADRVEWFDRHLSRRGSVVLSVHPHNDRGTAVAAAELAVMAGADRVEGTLFGNGERTGNVDVVTLALNLHTQGVDPGIDVFALDAVAADAVYCNRLPIHPRHPYAGELVYTAFSGSHQDAIKKGFADRAARGPSAPWEVPYLPIDPADVGRTYEAVVRVNSQSGKGGVAFVLEADHGYRLPRSFQVAMSRVVQARAEAEEAEVGSEAILALFEAEWLHERGPVRLVSHDTDRARDGRVRVRAHVEIDGAPHLVRGEGVGPVEAFVQGIGATLGVPFAVASYDEHAVGQGAGAMAVAYVELDTPDGVVALGVGRDRDIETAPLRAIVGAANRALRLAPRARSRAEVAR